MKLFIISILLFFCASLIEGCSGSPSGNALSSVTQPSITGAKNYYVNAQIGSDNNDGSSSTQISSSSGPWLTLHKAGVTVTAGAIVHVADGTYNVNGTLGGSSAIETKNSGTSSAWITYISDNQWGAKIINTNTTYSGNNIAWTVEGSYQIVENFDISGGPYTGIFVDGNHVQLIGNHLHDISSTSCNPGSFIYANSPYQYIDSIGNVMHDGGMLPWPSYCSLWHGIYYGGTVTGPVQYGQISENMIYRISGFGIHFWHKVSNIDVLNNLIFYNIAGGIIVGGSDGSTNDYFNIENNIVIYNSNMLDNTGGPASVGWGISQYINGGTVGSHSNYLNNLIYGNQTSNGWGGAFANQAAAGSPSGTISQTLLTNPLLVNYQNSPAVPTIVSEKIAFSNADYHLTISSPALNTGNITFMLPTSLDGSQWPGSNACDIGPN